MGLLCTILILNTLLDSHIMHNIEDVVQKTMSTATESAGKGCAMSEVIEGRGTSTQCHHLHRQC